MPLVQSDYYTKWQSGNQDIWWYARLEQACLDVAYDIMTESDSVENHALRLKFALEAKSNPNNMARYVESYVQEQATFVSVGKVMFDADLKDAIVACFPVIIKKYS
jgi:hypothetical protein